jgi:hypothetical protein
MYRPIVKGRGRAGELCCKRSTRRFRDAMECDPKFEEPTAEAFKLSQHTMVLDFRAIASIHPKQHKGVL